MKLYSCLVISAVGLWCCSIAYADAPGSSDAEIQKNFNKLIATNKCPRCDLSGAVLTRMDLTGADLEGANLSGAKLSLTNFSTANLKNADLRGAVLGGADFAGADLRGADLTGAMLEGAYFKDVLLDGELIREKPYEPEDPPEKVPDELSDSENTLNADFSRTELAGDKLEPQVPDDISSSDTPAVESKESGASTPSVAATNVTVAAPVSQAVQRHERDDAEILGSLEKRSTPVTSKVLSSMAEVVVPGSAPTPSQVDYSAIAPRISTPRVLEDIPVIETGSDKKEVKVSSEGELSIWDTLSSLFYSYEPEKKRIVGKEKSDVSQQLETPVVQHPVSKITGDRSGKNAPRPAQQDRSTTPELKPFAVKYVTGAEKDERKSGKNREFKTYTVETFEQSKAKQQVLVNKLLDENRCVACDLAGANLVEEDLDGADLERADLRGADLEGVDLSEANLKGTNFNSANLKNADLRKADLYLADFTNADLTGARLEGALVDSTDFTGAVGLNLKGGVEEE